jgi:hypothetical protein
VAVNGEEFGSCIDHPKRFQQRAGDGSGVRQSAAIILEQVADRAESEVGIEREEG